MKASTHGSCMNKREAILDATLTLLASKGFHGFSIKQVADHAGVAAGTVYLYFADREDLILQLQTVIIEKIATHIFARHDETKPLFVQYRQFCLSFWGLFAQEPDVLLSKAQFDHLPPALLSEKYEHAREILHPLMTFLERGRQESVLKDMPDEVLFSLAFECYFILARKNMLDLVKIDDATLEKIIVAGWDAIALKV